jgi:hypothetical protein
LKAVGMPEGVFERVPLELARAGVVIAPSRLRAEGRWPALLRCPSFARGRQIYEQAVEDALKAGARGALSTDAAARIDRAIDDLRDGCESVAATVSPDEQGAARIFLNGLSKAARVLHQPAAEAALTAVLSNSGTTVPELLELMRQHRLQFGAADAPDERASYQDLYPLLVKQVDRLGGRSLGHERRPAPAQPPGGEGDAGSRR